LGGGVGGRYEKEGETERRRGGREEVTYKLLYQGNMVWYHLPTVVAVEVMMVDHLELVQNVVTVDWETATRLKSTMTL